MADNERRFRDAKPGSGTGFCVGQVCERDSKTNHKSWEIHTFFAHFTGRYDATTKPDGIATFCLMKLMSVDCDDKVAGTIICSSNFALNVASF